MGILKRRLIRLKVGKKKIGFIKKKTRLCGLLFCLLMFGGEVIGGSTPGRAGGDREKPAPSYGPKQD